MNSYLDGRASVSSASANIVRPTAPAASLLPQLGSTAAKANVSTGTPAGLQPFPPHRHGEAKVETVEVEGVIQKIIITCPCGERIEVHCGY